MIKKSSLLLALSLVIFFYSCSNDGEVETVEEIRTPAVPTDRRINIDFPDAQNVVTRSLTGRIVDSDGQAIENALITCKSCVGDLSVMSDVDGNFNFQSIENIGTQVFLSASSSGKFTSYRRLALLDGKQNYTSIQLRDKILVGVVSAAEGSTVTDKSGAQVTLPKDGILDSDGFVYDGDYNVYISWIDPSDNELNETIMGDLSAIDKDGSLVGLSTFGMLQVELESKDGVTLNLSGGASSELKFPVPASLRSKAPVSIPLWSYDETFGYWVEEGQAELIGNNYVGTVTHFSTWNVDTTFEPVELCGEVQIVSNGNELGLPYYEIRLSGSRFNTVAGWLSEDGSFSFLNIPSEEILTLEIINFCGELVETIQLGPYNADTKITDPILLSDNTDINDVLITGNALACNGSVVSNGNVQIRSDDRVFKFPLSDQGEFLFTVALCTGSTSTMSIINLDDTSISSPIVISGLNNNYVLDDIAVCEVNEEYFYLEYEDDFGLHSHLVVDPELLWYEKNFNGFLFNMFLPVDTLTNCYYTYSDGATEPTDDWNGDGVLNEDDCVIGFTHLPTVFALTQNLVLDQVINGREEDGLFLYGNSNITKGESFEFQFTEVGPLDAAGKPTVIAGTLKGDLINYRVESINASFRLMPI